MTVVRWMSAPSLSEGFALLTVVTAVTGHGQLKFMI